VVDAMKHIPRASSLVENLNSRLRNYFFLRRQLGAPCLNLLQFFLNHRTFLRSHRPERVGKSPKELMTGQSHPHWLELLGFTRFQLPWVERGSGCLPFPFSSSLRPKRPHRAAGFLLSVLPKTSQFWTTPAIGNPQNVALILNQTTKSLIRLHVGEAASGWYLRSVDARTMTLEKNNQLVTLSLPTPGATPASPQPFALAGRISREFWPCPVRKSISVISAKGCAIKGA
jgi:hypothetical protein